MRKRSDTTDSRNSAETIMILLPSHNLSVRSVARHGGSPVRTTGGHDVRAPFLRQSKICLNLFELKIQTCAGSGIVYCKPCVFLNF